MVISFCPSSNVRLFSIWAAGKAIGFVSDIALDEGGSSFMDTCLTIGDVVTATRIGMIINNEIANVNNSAVGK